jgi:hypothetical protein
MRRILDFERQMGAAGLISGPRDDKPLDLGFPIAPLKK